MLHYISRCPAKTTMRQQCNLVNKAITALPYVNPGMLLAVYILPDKIALSSEEHILCPMGLPRLVMLCLGICKCVPTYFVISVFYFSYFTVTCCDSQLSGSSSNVDKLKLFETLKKDFVSWFVLSSAKRKIQSSTEKIKYQRLSYTINHNVIYLYTNVYTTAPAYRQIYNVYTLHR